MKYPKYPKYKDSGTEWIGEIPEHWETRKIKYLSPVMRGASPRPIDDPKYFDEDGDYAWVRIADVTASDGLLESTSQRLSALGASLSVKLEPGELFVSIAGSVGKPCITGTKACIHDGFVYFPKLHFRKEFVYRIFEVGYSFSGLGKLGTQLNLNTETVGSIKIPIPSQDEVNKILEFLRSEVNKIDLSISKQQQLIELFKEKRQAIITHEVTKGLDPNVPMKDSGIEWIGEIPEHWNLTRLKRICQFNYGDSLPSEDRLEGDFPVFGSNGIIDYSNRTNTGSPTIIIGRKGSYGKLTYSTLPGFAIDTTFYINECGSRARLKWLYYALGILNLENNSKDTGVPGLSREDALEKIIALPNPDEQLSISEFLDSSTINIDSIVSKQQQIIELLKEYKTSLVTQAVTGKIDVRGIMQEVNGPAGQTS